MVQIERRSHIRLPLTFKTKLKMQENLVLRGHTRNLSMGGAFVELTHVPIVKKGDYFSLVLLPRFEFTCRVIHTNEAGVGLQFDFILIKYYEQFKKLMLHNAPDPDRLIKEIGRWAND